MVNIKAEDVIKRQTYLIRYGTGLANKLNELINDSKLLSIINKGGSVNKVEKSVYKEMNKQQKTLLKTLRKELSGLVKLERQWLLQFFPTSKKTAIKSIVEDILNYQIYDSIGSDGEKMTPLKIYEGAITRKETQIADLANAKNFGLISTEQALLSFAAIQNQFKRNIETGGITSAAAAGSYMREVFYQANKQVRGVLLSAVLDGRTTQFCKGIDGTIFPKDEGIRPPFHYRCRTIALPVTVDETDAEAKETLQFRPQVKAGSDYQEKGVKGKKNLKRNRETGQIKTLEQGQKRKSGTSYGYFLSSQMGTKSGQRFIQDTLGKRRGDRFIKLVNSGKSPETALQEVLNIEDARTLTLEGLKKRT